MALAQTLHGASHQIQAYVGGGGTENGSSLHRDIEGLEDAEKKSVVEIVASVSVEIGGSHHHGFEGCGSQGLSSDEDTSGAPLRMLEDSVDDERRQIEVPLQDGNDAYTVRGMMDNGNETLWPGTRFITMAGPRAASPRIRTYRFTRRWAIR